MARIRKSSLKTPAKEIQWYIGLYKRLSKEDRLKASGEATQSRSIANQGDILNDFVKDYFEEGTYVIVDVFTDDGLTGTDDNRPDFQRMKQYAVDKKINCIVLKSLARAFRNIGDQSKFIEEFCPRHQLRFINTGEPFIDTYMKPRSAYSMEVPFHGILNERFAQQTSIEVRKTFDMKRKKGLFIGAFAPYGYQKNQEEKGKLIVDDEPAQVVKDIFNWFVYDGLSKRGISKKLTQTGIPCPAEYKRQKGFNYQNPNSDKCDGGWSATTVDFILKNKMYIGHMVQGRQEVISYKVHDCVNVPEEKWYIVENTHEALIDIETFQKAQTMLKRDVRTANGKKEVHMFSGFLRCADCNKALHRKASKNLVYYFCRSYVDKGLCTKHTIRLDVLEKSVLVAIREQIKLVEALSDTTKHINDSQSVRRESSRLNHGLTKAEKELAQITDAIDSLYVDLKTGIITQPEYVRLKPKLSARQEELQDIICNIKAEMQIMEQGIGDDDPYLMSFLEHKNIESLTRGILVELIDTIYVHENGGLTIEFNFADQFKRIVDFIENNKNDIYLVESKNVG